jgi:hypothetical protein
MWMPPRPVPFHRLANREPLAWSRQILRRFEARCESPDGNATRKERASLPGFYASLWYGLWAPARTSQEIVAKLNAAAADALADATVRARLVDLGFEIFPREQQKPAALAALQKAEIEKWWPIIKEFGIKGE